LVVIINNESRKYFFVKFKRFQKKNHSALFWQPKTTKQKLKAHKQKVKNCSTFAK